MARRAHGGLGGLVGKGLPEQQSSRKAGRWQAEPAQKPGLCPAAPEGL